MAHTDRIIVSMPTELLKELDVYVKEHKYNRSECIRHAIRELIQKEHVQQSI